MTDYREYDLVQKCLLQIEDKLGWGSSQQWHNEVFNELSETIQHKTQILLSPTTLKRVWGKVNYNSAPSISTLNALAQFADYENWRDFKIKIGYKPKSKFHGLSLSNHGIILTIAAFLAIAFISLFSMIGLNENSKIVDSSLIKFTSRPVTVGLPNSVVFDFDLNGLESDSIYIQQFWDPTKTVKIKADQSQATGIYYYPGYFRAKLLLDGKILKEHDLFVKAPQWVGTLDYEPVPKYISNNEVQNATLLFPENIIDEIKTSKEPLISTFHFVDEIENVSVDNFELECSIKNVYNDKWAVCQTSRIVILGTKGAMIIPFSIPGCTSDIGLMLNDVYYNGKERDLSAFGIDLREKTNINIAIKDKNVVVSIEGEEIFNGKYYQSAGKLVGFRFRFLGAGEVQSISIKNGVNLSVISLL